MRAAKDASRVLRETPRAYHCRSAFADRAVACVRAGRRRFAARGVDRWCCTGRAPVATRGPLGGYFAE
ncbi:hypothetical protein WS70_05085 [Burkholderia mayonis]|uniref:Uncharacterized protein n=1 Tax=Burkholderia mayonis TaxID=1385591 RepID=A0A1B4G4U9_9BURK|nr:hypothetical protein WS70_05085 [Burkholderia mayonis]KVD77537.1 hypothetical protein WS62_30050 [Burkholderia sp. ABCPW 14]KVE44740.1 hypothetical protein WS69_19450 [Burkholderia sp. BDU5]AOJ10937.1 hypothetical protein WS71_27785 [Burkholderia mayonis]KVE46817.1 hypothetical protein WS70_02265 [Burkholderia mayonis]